MKRFPEYSRSAQAGFVIGLIMVLFGIARLITMGYGPSWWTSLVTITLQTFGYLWPMALMTMGGVLLWAGMTHQLDTVIERRFNRPLRASSQDVRIAGVCGGLAEFSGLSSVLVRVLFVLLFFVFPWFGVALYLVLLIALNRT